MRSLPPVELALADLLAVGRLKYLRHRSIANPTWRDARLLRSHLTRRYLNWAIDSPLEQQRLTALRALDAWDAAVKKSGADEGLWQNVVEAVDRLIRDAETAHGHRIRPRAL